MKNLKISTVMLEVDIVGLWSVTIYGLVVVINQSESSTPESLVHLSNSDERDDFSRTDFCFFTFCFLYVSDRGIGCES